jgi:hypothetical protein
MVALLGPKNATTNPALTGFVEVVLFSIIAKEVPVKTKLSSPKYRILRLVLEITKRFQDHCRGLTNLAG